MPGENAPRYPPGKQPYDSLNAVRIGVVAGGILGAGVTALTSIANLWLVGLFAVIGGIVGFWSRRFQ